MGGDEILELELYQKYPDKTFIQKVQVSRWEDFKLMHIKPDSSLSNDEMNSFLSEIQESIVKKMEGTPVVLLGNEFDVDLYLLRPKKKVDPNQLELALDG